MQVQTEYGLAEIEQLRYANDRLALQLTDVEDGSPIATLTVNLPDLPLAEGEFFVKSWSGNEGIADSCRKSGLFVDTGKRVCTGHVQAEVWRFA